MKNLIKVATILLISVMIMLFTTTVNAADNDAGFTDLTGTLNNTSSKYNNTNKNTNLPKTGIEDSIPVALLVVVFGISAVYAYKKINEYKNI